MDKHKKKDNNKFLDDMTALTRSAFTSAAGMKRDLLNFVKFHVEGIARKMNFVRREEFNVVKKSVIQNKKELEKILEKDASGHASATHSKAKPAASSKSAAKKKASNSKASSAKKAVAKKATAKKIAPSKAKTTTKAVKAKTKIKLVSKKK